MLDSMNTATAASVVPWLAAVADALDEAIWVWDPADRRVLLANAAFQRQYGAAAGVLEGGADVLLARVHPEDLERLRRARAALPAHGYTEEYRLWLPTTGGQHRTARVQERALPTPAPDGRPKSRTCCATCRASSTPPRNCGPRSTAAPTPSAAAMMPPSGCRH
jgi:PAS domain-containing protein